MEEKQFHGLSTAEVEDRIRMDHANQLNISVSKTKSEIVKEHSLTYFNFLNLFLAILVAATGQFKNMTFMGVIFFNTAIGIIQELKVKALIDKISVMTVTKTKVIRDGKKTEITVDKVVIDDIICVESGQQICADCRILDTAGIEVNESMITGESRPVKKKDGDELISGSYVISGTATCKVFHVAEDNYAVSLARKAGTKKRASSQMQEAVRKIIKIDGALLIPVGILLFISQRSAEGTTISDAIVQTVAGVIGMIPEGLVLLTSISFVLGVGRLAKKRALVQEMESIEALARVNVLCVDKTGTITTGDLNVIQILPFKEKTEEDLESLMRKVVWSSEETNPTQSALKKRFSIEKDLKIKEKIPFSSERKYQAVEFEEEGGYALGAPEFLLPEQKELMEKVTAFTCDGMRVLLLVKCRLDTENNQITDAEEVGLIVLEDVIRKEAIDTFKYFHSRNVDVKVISGDHPQTVSSIAVKAGLSGAEHYCDARELPNNFEGLCKAVEKYTVFGRVKPEQKQDIIKAYQANGHVVGMVGDGVNDVLALKDADCGIAMAAGSDAAKQVAHIVLLDSDFSCMQNIVSEGKTIISNIEKVSALYLTKTLYSILLCIIFIFWKKAYPYIPIQLSWISGIAIGVPSFLLTLEKNENGVSNGFLTRVMRISLPAALTMVAAIIMTEIMSPFWGEDQLLTSLFHLVIGGSASLAVVYRVCIPWTKRHKALFGALLVIFVAGILIAPGFLGVHPLRGWQCLFLVPMICMIVELNRGLTELSVWIGQFRKNHKNNK